MRHIPGRKFQIIREGSKHPMFSVGFKYDLASITNDKEKGGMLYTFRNLDANKRFSLKFQESEDADKFLDNLLKLSKQSKTKKPDS